LLPFKPFTFMLVVTCDVFYILPGNNVFMFPTFTQRENIKG